MRAVKIGLAVLLAGVVLWSGGSDAFAVRYEWQLYEEWNFGGTDWNTQKRVGDVQGLLMDRFSSTIDSVDGEIRGNPHCILDLPQSLPRWMTIPGKQGWGLVITYRLTNPTTEPGNLDASFELFDMFQGDISAPNEWRFLSVSGQWTDGGNNLEVYAMGNRNNAATRADGKPQRTSINGWNRFNNKASANYQTVAVVWNPNADGGTYWTYDDDPFTDPTAPLNSTTTNFPHWSGDDPWTPGESRRRYVGQNYAGNALLVGDISYVGLHSLEQLAPPIVVTVNVVNVESAPMLQFDSEAGIDYELECSLDGSNWMGAGFATVGDGNIMHAFDPDGFDTNKNYRMAAQQ